MPEAGARLSVRFATVEDVPELVRVINLAYRVEDFFINGNRTTEADVAERLEDPSVRFPVIDGPGGSVAATAIVNVNGDRGHFGMLSVDPAMQGQGLGRAMIEHIESYCRSAGCSALDIGVVNLRDELPPFYRARGFTECGTAPFPDPWKLSRDAHLVLMTKSLATSGG